MFDKLTGTRKKVIVFLATISLGGSLFILRSTQSATKVIEPNNSITDPCQPSKSSESDIKSLFENDKSLSDKSGYSIDSELYIRTILAVLLVIVLGTAGIYLSRKLLPKLTNLPGKKIHIVETVHIGPRRSVHLLEIDNRRFLIGSTNENISTLADLNPTYMDLSDDETDINFEKKHDQET